MKAGIILQPTGETLVVPASIGGAGNHAPLLFVVFFTALICNSNTRVAYAQAVAQFLRWSQGRRLSLRGKT
jgi:hypothetical protein